MCGGCVLIPILCIDSAQNIDIECTKRGSKRNAKAVEISRLFRQDPVDPAV